MAQSFSHISVFICVWLFMLEIYSCSYFFASVIYCIFPFGTLQWYQSMILASCGEASNIMEELMRQSQQLVRQNQQILEGMQQMIHNQRRTQVYARTPQPYNTHMYGQSGHPTMPHFLDEQEERSMVQGLDHQGEEGN